MVHVFQSLLFVITNKTVWGTVNVFFMCFLLCNFWFVLFYTCLKIAPFLYRNEDLAVGEQGTCPALVSPPSVSDVDVEVC